MLRSAVTSMMQVSTITIQADILGLLRQILVIWLPKSKLVQDTLLQLPNISHAQLKQFQEQLLVTYSEKEQRNLIKQLLAEAGGAQARAVLSALSHVPVMNVVEPKSKPIGEGVRPEEEIRLDWSDTGIAI